MHKVLQKGEGASTYTVSTEERLVKHCCSLGGILQILTKRYDVLVSVLLQTCITRVHLSQINSFLLILHIYHLNITDSSMK